MKFADAIDEYIRDMRQQGRLNSVASERTYRDILNLHCDDIHNRDPRTVGREDIKRTLRRWENPNTIRGRHAALISFYDWTMEEGHRKDNPARQVRRPKKRPTSVYRLSASEIEAMWNAPTSEIERRAIRIGLGTGLRSAELRQLQGRHLQRPGLIWVSGDIAKGGRERWVPVIADLELLVRRLAAETALEEYVVCGQRNASPARNTYYRLDPARSMGATTLYKLVHRVAERAGIDAPIYPHLMRHAYADHVARQAGIRIAQSMLGHADISTTRGYMDIPTIDELMVASTRVRLVSGLPPDGARFAPRSGDGGNRTHAFDFSGPRAKQASSQLLAGVLLDLRPYFVSIVRSGGAA